jgi:hypothetical protein
MGRGGAEGFQERLAEREDLIKTWKSQKAQIVDNRVTALLQDIRPFPWD